MKAKSIDILATELTRDEGEKLKPYKCTADKLTIGVGRNLEDRGISREESRYLLKNDMRGSIADAEKFPWFEGLTPKRQRVIVNIIFNIGLPRFKKFKKTIRYINCQQFDHASIEMLDSLWARQVGKRAKRLSVMMREG